MKPSLDYLARALIPRESDTIMTIKMNKNETAVLYRRRWYILAAYCLNYFFWLVSTTRHIPLISEHALRFDTTNEVSFGDDGPGVDMIGIISSGTSLLFYLLGGVVVDKYGLTTMSWGSIGMAIGAWGWYFFGDDLVLVLLSLTFINFAGCILGVSLLKIATLWFGEKERTSAVAIGSVAAVIGAGAGLVFGPLFTTGEPLINGDLRSCDQQFIQTFNQTTLDQGIECNDEATDKFCCVAETDLDSMNLAIAVIVTLVALFTVATVRQEPKTPPTKTATVKKGTSFINAMRLMFKHKNYALICLTDFLSSGPPVVVFSTIDRIFPASVSELAIFAAAGGVILSIPSAAVFSCYLTKTKKYYEFTRGAYVAGFVSFAIVTVLVLFENDVVDLFVLVLATLSIMIYILWSISVYELKMEYVFDKEIALQANIVALDRFIINLSLIIFLLLIPPERYKGDIVSGRQFTFLIGVIPMFLGAAISVFLPNKRKYLREAFENQPEEDDKSKPAVDTTSPNTIDASE